MSANRLLLIVVALLGLFLAGGQTRGIELDPLKNGLYKDWKLVQDEHEAWEMDTGVLVGKAKGSKVGEAIYEKGPFGKFELFFQIDKTIKKTNILLIPEEGERVEIELEKKWVDRRQDWTLCVLRVNAGKATMEADGEHVAEWEVPDKAYRIGFGLERSGRARIYRVRILWDKPPEKVQPLEGGFINLLGGPEGIDTHWSVWKHPEGDSVPGEFIVQGGVLSAKNTEVPGLSQKICVRLSKFRVGDYELRFKVKDGARDVELLTHLGNGQAGSLRTLLINSYLSGAGPWHQFVVKFANSKISVAVNGRENAVPPQQTANAPTAIGWRIRPGGKIEVKDMHIRSTRLRDPNAPAPDPDAGNAGGGGGGQPTFFNGKDLEGWAPRPEGVWKVTSDGALFGSHQGGRVASLLYRYPVRADYKVSFRAELGTNNLGFVTRLVQQPTQKDSKVLVPAKALTQDWNQVDIIVKGTQASVVVNGKQIGTAPALAGPGFIGFILTSGGACRLKDLKIGAP